MLEEIKPRIITYLYSGGKDSSLALLLTRDRVREYADKHNVNVYILYIAIPGNTHPLNAFCSAKVMYWHKKHYGFQPVFMARDKVFQAYMAKYGLQKGSRRWCYTEFKWKVLKRYHQGIALFYPALYVDGMDPRDSKHREQIISSEFQHLRTGIGEYWVWHPLYSWKGDKMKALREHEEFRCVAKLYEKYGDSLNCVVCPYKNRSKLIKYHFQDNEALDIIYDFMSETMRSRQHLKNHRPPDGDILGMIN